MPERRVFSRTDLKVFARGYVTLGGGKVFPFGATVANLSEGGAKLVLNPDALDRFKSVAMLDDGSAVFDKMPVTFDIISYVQDNARVTGRIAYVASLGGGASFGVEFGGLDPDTRACVRRVIDAKPELEITGADASSMERSFLSIDEFIGDLTPFCINSGKEDMFRIAGELFRFVGMHISPSGEPHLDLIESQEHPGKIFCPDCKAYVDQTTMI